MNTSKVYMAFASGKESIESAPIKRYIGVAPVFVVGVNPNKETLDSLYKTSLDKEPEYIGSLDDNGKKIPYARIDFILKSDSEKCNGIDMISKVSFFLRKEYRYNFEKTKVQIINKYGETAWPTVEEAKSGKLPENLSWFDAENFRPAYVGEDELTKFIKAYLNIPGRTYKNRTTGEVVTIDNLQDAEARLEKIEELFKGNFKELKTIIAFQPNNKVKVLFGVKTTEENKQYQDVYSQMFLKNNISDYTRLAKDLEDRKAAGGYSNTEFEVCPIREYSLEKTDLNSNITTPPTDDLPEAGSPWNN